MPDDYASETFFDKTKQWVEQNPGLAVLAFAGAGLVVGRLVTGLVPDRAPETLTERIESRARELGKDAKKRGRKARKQGRGLVEEAAATVEDGYDRARHAVRGAAGSAADSAHDGADRMRDLADTIADAVKVALSGVAAKKVDDWVDRVRR